MECSLTLIFSCLRWCAGRPQPKVTWWREGVEIAGTSHPSADEGNPAMLNQLFISTVTRDYYGSKLECRAQGSNLIEAVVKEITVQVHCKCFLTFTNNSASHQFILCCRYSKTNKNKNCISEWPVDCW